MSRVLSIRNRQQLRAINTPLLRRITETVLREDFDVHSYELAVHLLTADAMAALNEKFLQHEGSTDVITFDHTDLVRDETTAASAGPMHLHGEIFLSVPDAIHQARDFKTTWQSEVIRYVIHGLLHLMGHDDLDPANRRTMKFVENQFVKRMSAVFPLTKLGRPGKRRTQTKRGKSRARV